MATYRRAIQPGGCFFFTVCTERRQRLLTEPPVIAALRAAFLTVKREHPFTIDAIVVLPDHLHTIWTLPQDDAAYALRWNLIKRKASAAARDLVSVKLRASHRARHEIGLWQRRYWEHQIRDDLDFARHVDYIHWNPVKHGHVERAADWPHSSFHKYVQRGDLPIDWASASEFDDDRFGERP